LQSGQHLLFQSELTPAHSRCKQTLEPISLSINLGVTAPSVLDTLRPCPAPPSSSPPDPAAAWVSASSPRHSGCSRPSPDACRVHGALVNFRHHLPNAHSRVTAIIKGRQGITATTALKLGKYFGTPPEYWLNIQHMHDIAAAREEQGDALSRIRPICA